MNPRAKAPGRQARRFALGLALCALEPDSTEAASAEQQLMQVEKQARLVREAAERFVAAAERSAEAGRPVQIAVLEAENEAVKVNLRRLRTWVGEL